MSSFRTMDVRSEKDSRTYIAVGRRTNANMYHLEGATKHCLISQLDDKWLWYQRMYHINFDNLIRISSKNAVRDFPRLSKPGNNIYKECPIGN